MSETEVNQILLNLKIIAMLRQHERFSTQNNIIIVEKNSIIQGITRWFRGEKRELNLEFLQDVFNRAFSYLQSCIYASASVNKSSHAYRKLCAAPASESNTATHMPSMTLPLFLSMPSILNKMCVPSSPLLCAPHTTITYQRVLNEIEKALGGIKNLQTTYEGDPLMIARIQVTMDGITVQLQFYKAKLSGYNDA